MSTNICVLLCVSYVLSVSVSADVRCSHKHPRENEVLRGVHIEAAHLLKKRSVDQPLRIKVFYGKSLYRLPTDQFDIINNIIVPDAVTFWEKALKVRKTGGPIKLNRNCPTRQVFTRDGRSHCVDTCSSETTCGGFRVPEEHLNPCYVCDGTGDNCTITTKTPSDNFAPGPDWSSNDEIETPQSGSSGVEDTDFILYVSAAATLQCKPGITASAVHCQQESVLDRPVAGHLNFCPSGLSSEPRNLQFLLSTVKHELLHALGFSVSLYAFYRDDNGDPLTERNPDTGNPAWDEMFQVHKWSERVVKNITRKNWKIRGGHMDRAFSMIVTPRVVKEVRDHFNCSELEGAELEDQGGDGTALTHWEKRVFDSEGMTASKSQSPVFSRITFALMEDTGWYRANYDLAEPLHWGKGLGCSFAMSSCKQWLDKQKSRRRNPAPFCTSITAAPLQSECSPTRDTLVMCNLKRYDNVLPISYQYFDTHPDVAPGDETHYGGSVILADYCPYLQEFTWKRNGIPVRGSRCSHHENEPESKANFALEKYGLGSKCFQHQDEKWLQKSCTQVREWQYRGSGCYTYKCESGRIHIMVGNYSYTCYHANQIIHVHILNNGWLHTGGLVCPPCKELCAEELGSRNEYCKGGEEPLPPNLYPNDVLTCAATTLSPARV